jgi:Cdc6-like AAA superfamily ATPase
LKLIRAALKEQLNYKKICWEPSDDEIIHRSTEEIAGETKIVGQERALKALRLGAEIFSHGYNIYIAGMSGTGKASTIKKVLEEIKPKNIKLKDYAYVNNFKDPERPILLVFEAGEAVKFKKDVESAIEYLRKKNTPSI